MIFKAIAFGEEIQLAAYNAYPIETAKMFFEEYGWFNMPMTVHKVLIYGTIIILSTFLPIGQLTEEAQESRNKDIRK